MRVRVLPSPPGGSTSVASRSFCTATVVPGAPPAVAPGAEVAGTALPVAPAVSLVSAPHADRASTPTATATIPAHLRMPTTLLAGHRREVLAERDRRFVGPVLARRIGVDVHGSQPA